MRKTLWLTLLAFWLLPAMTRHAGADVSHELERSVCGLKEPVLFWLWNNAAGRPAPERVAGLRGIEEIVHTTRDGRNLHGYRLAARTNKAQGYLLVLQGNAILADQLIGEFTDYARAGYDVYMYDYRGYGRSQGKRRLQALVSDTAEILAALNAQNYPRRLVYAFSFGGILLLDAYRDDFKLDRIVIDSSPARLSDYGCPPQFDPVAHLPAECSQFMFIMGLRDTVVTPGMSSLLLDTAHARKARVSRQEEFAHPFMDASPAIHRRRLQLIADFLLQ